MKIVLLVPLHKLPDDHESEIDVYISIYEIRYGIPVAGHESILEYL